MLARLRDLFAGAGPDREFDREIEEHLALLQDRFVREGMTPEQAHYAARRQFGGVAQIKQERRETRGFPPIEIFFQDLRHAIRALWSQPAFTAAALATLALGIGANTAMFSVIDTVLLKPLHAPQADRIVRFLNRYPEGVSDTAGFPEFNVWRRQTALFEDVSAHRLDPVNLTGEDPEQIQIARVSAAFFRLFGARVSLGRTFSAEEDRPSGGRVVVLSSAFFERRFGGDARALEKAIVLGSESYRIIGVLAPGFDSEQFTPPPDVWVPFQIDPATSDEGSYTWVTARLKPGVTIAMANAQLEPVAEEYRRTFRALNPRQTFAVEPLMETMVGQARSPLVRLLGAVSFVLLIACANVASLLLVRAAGRKREFAIRAAVGSTRGRLLRQLLTESLLLSLAGGALGLGLGWAGIRALLSMYPDGSPLYIPRLGEGGGAVALDWRVAGFTFLVSLVTGVLFGLLPALQASRPDLSAAFKDSGGSRPSKTRALLVVVEIALTLVLLVGAALQIRDYARLRLVQPGFDSHNVQTLQMSLSATRFEKTAAMSQLVREGSQRIRALPGVEAAGAACCVPLETVWQLPFIVQGRPLNGPFHAFAGWTFISPGYFETFRIPLLRGRAFTDRDDASAPGVAIINEAMAHRYWPDGDPLNDRLIVGRGMRPEYDKDPVRQIVGIVGDVRDQRLNARPRPAMYVPIAQLPDGINLVNLRLLPIAWFVRTGLPSQALSKAIEQELRQASGGLPVARVRPMDQVKLQSLASVQFSMLLVTIFGGLALLLAAVGVYGVMAYAVEQRTRELGIRLALGAEGGALRNVVISQAMRLALAGIAAGLAAAAGLARLNFLLGGPVWDPVLLSAPAVLGLVALAAAWVPAVRATRVDPVTALRWE